MNMMLRPKKDGTGVSVCKSPEHAVGKRRCNHLHCSENNSIQSLPINYDKETHSYFVEVTDDSLNMTIREQKKYIKNMVQEFKQSITEQQRNNILSAIRAA